MADIFLSREKEGSDGTPTFYNEIYVQKIVGGRQLYCLEQADLRFTP